MEHLVVAAGRLAHVGATISGRSLARVRLGGWKRVPNSTGVVIGESGPFRRRSRARAEPSSSCNSPRHNLPLHQGGLDEMMIAARITRASPPAGDCSGFPSRGCRATAGRGGRPARGTARAARIRRRAAEEDALGSHWPNRLNRSAQEARRDRSATERSASTGRFSMGARMCVGTRRAEFCIPCGEPGGQRIALGDRLRSPSGHPQLVGDAAETGAEQIIMLSPRRCRPSP